jgi:hypothetical protein
VKKHLGLIVVLVLLLAAAAYFFLRLPGPEPAIAARVRKPIYNFDLNKCPGDNIQFTMNDLYMRGIVEKDQVVDVTLNWYTCNPPETNDLVLYRFSEFDDPVVRRVVGKAGDSFGVVKDAKGRGWNIVINKKIILSNGKPHFFGVDDPPPLWYSTQSRKGILGEREVVLLSSFPPGHLDSATLGIVDLADVIGKVYLANNQLEETTTDEPTDRNTK